MVSGTDEAQGEENVMKRTMGKKTEGKGGGLGRRLALTGAVAALALAVVVAAGCQPATTAEVTATDTAAQEQALAETGVDGMAVTNFQELSAGDFTDGDGFNGRNMNDGNRGCNSCHADLWTTISGDVAPIQHVLASAAGYGKTYGWTDCTTCHTFNAALGAPRLDTRIHNIHYASATFTDAENGNCWSCHETNADGELVMYDEQKYTAEASGYANAADPSLDNWLRLRGRSNHSANDVVIDNALAINVDLSQPTSDEADMYVANNYVVPELSAEDYTLTVTGVNNERTFTLDELRALPQTEAVVTQDCFTNASNSVLIGNIPIKGVLLADLIEACGGVADGNTTLTNAGADEWGHSNNIDFLLEQNAMIALEYWGHELTVNQGYPVTFVLPGVSGLMWDKWVVSMDFNTNDPTPNPWMLYDVAGMKRQFQGTICAGWFSPAKDGTEVKVGEAVPVSGYAYLDNYAGHELSQIAFSADYGTTWTTLDVPADFDQKQWTRFEGAWTPDTAGTYILQVKAIDAAGSEQYVPASVIVKVTE